jgi:hypothetical protein
MSDVEYAKSLVVLDSTWNSYSITSRDFTQKIVTSANSVIIYILMVHKLHNIKEDIRLIINYEQSIDNTSNEH